MKKILYAICVLFIVACCYIEIQLSCKFWLEISFPFVSKSHSAILMSLHPNAVSILTMVCMVKLCLPVNHLDISDSLLWSFWAKSFWVRFFAFRTSLMRSAILNESSNSAFCSSGIAARHCLNKAFCIIGLVLYFKCCTLNISNHILLYGYFT